MGSQESQGEDSILSLLAEAAEWTDEEILQRLPNVLPIVEEFLRGTPSAEEAVQVARCVCGLFLPHLQVDKKTYTLLHAALSCLQSAFNGFLQDCESEARKNIERVIKMLQQCNLVAECCELALQFLLQAEKVAMEDISNLPSALLHIVNLSLGHCKESENIYGSHLELLKENLSTLFQHAVSLSTQFAHLLSRVTFNSNDDLEILLQVCEQLCVTASCLSQLSEIRGCIVVWRAYATLVQQHHGELVTRIDLSSPLDALVKEIKDGFDLLASIPVKNSIMTERDEKVVQRIIKMTSFCLKIIVSLCEKFRGYLRGVHVVLASLLMLLFRLSPHNVTLQMYSDNIIKDMEQQVTTAIEPLLLHLRDDEEFIKVVLEIEQHDVETVAEEWGSYLLLIVALCVPPSTVIYLHLNKIIAKIFFIVEKSHSSLSLPCMMNGVMYGGRLQSKVTFYEHLLTRTCALVATLEAHHFEVLEQILVQWLLSGQPWPALLAMDIWCFVARFGSSELCKHHCSVLMDVLLSTPPSSHQCLMTASLLSRLIPKLAPHHKQEILSSLRDTDGLTLFQAGIKDCNYEQDLVNDTIITFTKNVDLILARTANEQTVINLLDELEHMSSLLLVFIKANNANTPVMASFTSALTQLWARMPEDHVGCSIVDLIFCHLVKATTSVLSTLSKNQLIQVLSLLNESCTKESAVVGVVVCDLVAALGQCHLTDSTHLNSILHLIADVMAGVLKSSNPLVHQCALDAFVVFGQHTLHEEVLPMCLHRCKKELKKKVASYLKQELFVLPEDQTKLLLLKQQNISCISQDISNIQMDFKPIGGSSSIETLRVHVNEHNPQDLLNQDQKPSKRLRDEDFTPEKEEEPDLKMLITSLHNSHNILKKVRNNLYIEERERDTIKSILQEMICTWDVKTNEN
ncbi:FIGNL1-interacting regulator of recombination and mitosis isoform X2 [Procambarus clarkii]|uniref:FIGNL1-interacting regulator of recombination and mitosis isoform X2 n=1 Tax=Procambarus clarkii TaxID=6728 RepID=UPI003742A612